MASRLLPVLAALLAGVLLAVVPARADDAESTLRPANEGLVGASADHTCAILLDGGVRCWGNGGFGELGYDSKTTIGEGANQGALMSTLQAVNLGGHKAVQVSNTGPSTCALLDDGSVRCWGAGGFGELGYDSTKNVGDGVAGDVTMANLTAVNLGQPAVQISGGDYHSCAILADGGVKCWGLGATGELGQASDGNAGDYTTSPSFGMANLPEVNLGGHKAVAISAGGPGNLDRGDTCAILDDGTVRCWGDDQFGQLGHDTTGEIHGGTASNSIVAHGAVPLPQKAVAISTGGDHTCVILADGTVRCWGDGEYGELGNDSTKNAGDGAAGDTTMASLPAVPLGQAATAISAGLLHTCAILLDGTLKCWGYDGEGQLGHDSETNYVSPMSALPATYLGGHTAIAVSTGEIHTCALLDNGTLRCWGLGGFGGLGYDSGLNVGDGVSGHTTMATLGAVPLAQKIATTSADLSLTMTPSAPTVGLGDAFTLTATLANAGPDSATGTTVGVTIPDGLELTSTDPSQGSVSGSTWTPGALGSGISATLVLHLTAPAAGTFSPSATVTGTGQPDPDSLDRAGTATVTAAAAGTPTPTPTPTPTETPAPTATPAPVASVQPAPVVTAAPLPGPAPITPAPAPTTTQLASGLSAQLKPTATLTISFKALVKGTVKIDWYEKGKKRVLVATGHASPTGPGIFKFKMKLTTAGRKLIKRHHLIYLIVRGTYAPEHGVKVTSSRNFTLTTRV